MFNLSLMKLFHPVEKITLRFQADFFNAFNITNFQAPATTVTSSNFGTIQAAYPGRNIQLGMKLAF